jgi:hypothetical protein
VAQKAFGPVEGPGGGDWHAEMQAKIFAVNDGLQKAEADRKQKRVSEGGAGRQPEADQEGLAMLGGEEVDWGDWMDVWSKDKETAEEEGAPGGDQGRSIGSEAAPGNAAAKGRVAEKAGARVGAGVGAGGGIGERGGGGEEERGGGERGGGGGRCGVSNGSAARPEWQGVLDVPKRVPGLGGGPRANAPAASPRKETPTGRGVQQPSPSPRREVGGGGAGRGGGGRLGLGIGPGDARSAARGVVGRESGGGGAVARGASPGVEVAPRRISYSLQEAKANEAEYKAKIKGAKSKLSKADCLFSPRGGQERDKGSKNAGLEGGGGGGGGGGGLGGGGGGPLMTGGGVAFTVEAGHGDGGGGDDAPSRMRMRMRGGGSGANQQPVGAHHDGAAAGEGGRRQAKGGIAFDLDMFEAPGVGSGGRETPSPSHQGWADGKAARRDGAVEGANGRRPLASPGGVLPRQIGAGSAARPPKSPVGVMPRASKAPLPSPQVGSRASKGAATTPAESPAPPGGPGAGVGDSPSVRGKAKRASLSDVIRKGREQRRESGSVEPEIEVTTPEADPFPGS